PGMPMRHPQRCAPAHRTGRWRRPMQQGAAACLLALGSALATAADSSTFEIRALTADTALKAARAALDACRKAGYQVGVAVTDRSGVLQVFLRDRFAGAHTVQVAADKAWTAASFRI